MIKIIILLLSIIGVSSCTFLPPVKTENVNNYVINRLPKNLPQAQPHPLTLLVMPPDTRAIYNTRQMVYTNKQYQISFYGKNQWAETPGQMLQALLVQSLQNTQYFRAILTAPYAGQYDYALTTTLLELQLDYTQEAPVARIAVNAILLHMPQNQIIATQQFSMSLPMTQATPDAGVMAINQAMAELLKKLTIFCLAHLPR